MKEGESDTDLKVVAFGKALGLHPADNVKRDVVSIKHCTQEMLSLRGMHIQHFSRVGKNIPEDWERPYQGSNLGSSAPETDALSTGPQGRR